MTLMRLRRNVVFGELAEDFGISVSTAWEHFQRIRDALAQVLAVDPEVLAASLKGKICLVDGTLVTVFNWRHRSDLYSGKHRRHGMNVQVVTDVHGRVLWVSPGHPGSWHDKRCFDATWLSELATLAGSAVADSGYQGSNMITPNKRQPGQERNESDVAHNTALAVIRAAIEWANAHLKNWRILATRYRDDLVRFDRTLTAVAGLQMLNEEYAPRQLKLSRLNKLMVSE
jgi:DDE superfamily endonuclease/Helix-turn-helix of DDE superfamily endonuclease